MQGMQLHMQGVLAVAVAMVAVGVAIAWQAPVELMFRLGASAVQLLQLAALVALLREVRDFSWSSYGTQASLQDTMQRLFDRVPACSV
jgi:hypothetical protein